VLITDKNIINENRIERILLHTNLYISKERLRIDNTILLASSNSPKGILLKVFVIPRVNNELYQGETLRKGTIITLEFKDKLILTEYIKTQS
jgi:exodeoxyribonuclease VII large subunit